MAKYLGYGTTVKLDSASSGSYTTIGQLGDVGGPDTSVDAVDVTTHDSASAAREFIMGLIDGGEVTLDIVYDPALATHQLLQTVLAARTNRPWRINFAGLATTCSFSGGITGLGPSAPVEDKLMCSVTIKVTGLVTWF